MSASEGSAALRLNQPRGTNPRKIECEEAPLLNSESRCVGGLGIAQKAKLRIYAMFAVSEPNHAEGTIGARVCHAAVVYFGQPRNLIQATLNVANIGFLLKKKEV